MQDSVDHCIPEKYVPLVIVLPAFTFLAGVIGTIVFYHYRRRILGAERVLLLVPFEAAFGVHPEQGPVAPKPSTSFNPFAPFQTLRKLREKGGFFER
ncbi:unnamed protein product [Penicillium camemberti]|uniref:Str. FM013 n=1 Tax=Penicillium camemberti (strain FM 013) TaxID=1429867 RepID=A0A0G4PFF7_PENC3|nr:unnamed protein product [Penicillium camemberti]